MRSILEELPHALLPDPEQQSDDPGVPRDAIDDDLVRPAVEEQLARSASRGHRSPLARHVVHDFTPIDQALPLRIGLRLHVEGVRVTDARIDAGYTHQALERRAVGLAVDDEPLWALVGRAEPPPLPRLTLALALERLAGIVAPSRAAALRAVVLDLVVVHEALAVLAAPALRAPRLTRDAGRLVRDVDALLQGVTEGGTLSAWGGLRRDLHSEERTALLRLLPGVRRGLDALPLHDVEDLRGVGVLGRDAVRATGVDGAAGRAAGVADELPADLAGAAAVPDDEHAQGCAFCRLHLRLADADAALRRVEAALRDLPDGPVTHRRVPDASPTSPRRTGVGHAVVRGPAGSWSVFVVVDDARIRRLRLRPPELALLGALPRALVGVSVDDAAAVIASFGMHGSALDR
jgi:Ni,Fe-hydrogenase III large subunit